MFFGYNNKEEAEKYFGDLSKYPKTVKTIAVCNDKGGSIQYPPHGVYCVGSIINESKEHVFLYSDGSSDKGHTENLARIDLGQHVVSWPE